MAERIIKFHNRGSNLESLDQLEIEEEKEAAEATERPESRTGGESEIPLELDPKLKKSTSNGKSTSSTFSLVGVANNFNIFKSDNYHKKQEGTNPSKKDGGNPTPKKKAIKSQNWEDELIKEMADKDYAPLSTLCVRALCDKMYDKRKAAALEIEKMTRECVQVQNTTQIQKLLRVLGTDFAMSQSPNMRKGGLIGLAAMSIGLGKETGRYVSELVKPIVSCMGDSDSRVRFYACESLYNVTKVARNDVLPMFNDIFTSMSTVVTDLDQSVRTAAELMDRLLKDIITEHEHFKVEDFVPILKDRMYSEDQFARSFHLGWIQAMHKVPNSTIVTHLPEIIDPMFLILTDLRPEIYVRCQRELEKFLTFIKEDPPKPEAFTKMINVLVLHVQSEHIRLQTMSVHWIRAFAEISGPSLFPYISAILTAILPNLSYDEENRRSVKEDEYKKIRGMSKSLYMDLMKIMQDLSPELLTSQEETTKKRHLESILDVVTAQLQSGKTESKVGSLTWITLLYTIVKPRMISYIDKIFPVLLKTLSDSNDEVVILDLRVLAVICEEGPPKNQHFKPFMNSLFRLFSADRNLLKKKGSYIIRQLSVSLNAEDIYRSMAELIQKETDLKFAREMVEYLHTILFTAKELQPLRLRIKELKDPESIELFTCLYKTWSHSQVATVGLVFLSGCYIHVLDLVKVISEQEVTMEFLLELDRFIQILESPIFSFLRYEMLDVETNGDLMRGLFGLMNLMPQTEAFKKLNDRIKFLPQRPFPPSNSTTPKKLKKRGIGNKNVKEIDFNVLLAHFESIQALHEAERQEEVSDDVVPKDTILIDLNFENYEHVDYPIVDEI